MVDGTPTTSNHTPNTSSTSNIDDTLPVENRGSPTNDQDEQGKTRNEVSSFWQALNTVYRIWSKHSKNADSNTRKSFNKAFKALDEYHTAYVNHFEVESDRLLSEITRLKREKERAINEWRERWERQQPKFQECMEESKRLFVELEKIREERDRLLVGKDPSGGKGGEGGNGDGGNPDPELSLNNFKRVCTILLQAITNSLDADRSAIFLYYEPRDQLRSLALLPNSSGSEIRIPAGKGVAGSVFRSGEALNISNAYQDKRFYRDVDKATGYVTKAVLCFPLVSQVHEGVMGVVQLINKVSGETTFSVQDEARLHEFSRWLAHFLESSEVDRIFSYKSAASRKNSSTESKQTKVKRIGYEENKGTPTAVVSKPNAFLPKEFEEYIQKLEQCWRKSVGENAAWQEKYERLREESESKDAEMRQIRNNLNNRMKETEDHNHKAHKEVQRLRNQLQEKEKMIQEMQELQNQHQQQNQDSSNAELLSSPSNEFSNSFSLRDPPSHKFSHKSASLAQSNSTPSFQQRSNANHTWNHFLPHINDSHVSRNHIANSTLSWKHAGKSNVTKPNFHENGRDVFVETFANGPIPMCILQRNYRIWRANKKMCQFLRCSEDEVLGLLFTDVTIGVDQENIPKLLTFDVIENLEMFQQNHHVPVTLHVGRVGNIGQKFSYRGKNVRGPLYVLSFYKV